MNRNYSLNLNTPKKKGNKVLIIILILIILTLICYISYDKLYSKNNNKNLEPEKTEKKEQKEEENLDMVAQYLISKLEKYYVDYFDSKEKVDFTKLTNEDLILPAYVYHNYTKLNEPFNKNSAKEYYKNLFNINLETYPDLKCYAGDGLLYKFNEEKNEYEEDCGINEGICHGHGGLNVHSAEFIKYKDIQKDGDNYIITVTKVFGLNIADSDGYFYSDYNYQTRINGLDSFVTETAKASGVIDTNLVNIDNVQAYYDSNYESFKDIKPEYKYTFKKINNDYYLTNFETIK